MQSVYSLPTLAHLRPAPLMFAVPRGCQPLQGDSRKDTYTNTLCAVHTILLLAGPATGAAKPDAVLGRQLRADGKGYTGLT